MGYPFTFHDVSINTDSTPNKTAAKSFFTFHDVSINTRCCFRHIPWSINALHSTMFLLILRILQLSDCSSGFTFHDVSINTFCTKEETGRRIALHSTMFLLIPVVYLSLQYRYNLTTFCQSCHFIIFILIFIFLDSSHF